MNLTSLRTNVTMPSNKAKGKKPKPSVKLEEDDSRGGKLQEAQDTKFAGIEIDCTVGYCKTRLYERPYFKERGIYIPLLQEASINERAITEKRIVGMVRSLIKYGFMRNRDANAIRIALEPDWYSNEMLQWVSGVQGKDIPYLELTDEGKKQAAAGNFHPIEGMGRRHGAERYALDREIEIKENEEKIKKLEEGKTGAAAASVEKIAALKGKILELQEDIEHASWWTLKILNQSK